MAKIALQVCGLGAMHPTCSHAQLCRQNQASSTGSQPGGGGSPTRPSTNATKALFTAFDARESALQASRPGTAIKLLRALR